VASIVAMQASVPVEAATTFLLPTASTETAGFSYTVVGPTTLVSSGGTPFYSSASAILIANATSGGANAGLHGAVTPPAPAPLICGVYGQATSAIGVYGTSGGTAVRGDVPSSPGASNGIGVHGLDGSTGTGGVGVRAGSDTGYGVFAQSRTNVGVYAASGSSYAVLGASSGAHGVTGTTSAAGYAGLIGQASANNTTGLVGTVSPGLTGAYAAQFTGTVLVNGAVVVGGGKSAAAKHKDGTHRLLYCVEAPDSWFEDFGTGTLVNGKAEIRLDPEFLGVVDTSQMHVFLTSRDESHHLAVTAQGKDGFAVAASASAEAHARGVKASDLSGTFSYRVVAKRGDIATPRLAKFTFPEIKGVTVPPVPPAPEPPKKQ
jgi:hypothetical protein